MNKPISLALIVVGLILLGFGIEASNSVGSGLSRLFTGAPTDRTIWLFVSGAAALVVGVVGLKRGK